MSKDPAFLFYSSDFISGVSDLTMEERGQYITLLCLQHQKGHLSDKLIKISLGNATADVMQKFCIDDNGLYFSKRLDVEIKKRAEHSEKQRQRAKDGWEKRKATADATALPLENENINKDIIINKTINNKNNEFFQILNTSEEWLNLTSSQSTNKFTVHQVKVRLKKFTDTQNAKFDYKANKKEFASHFVSWLNQQDNPEKPKKIS